jgi:hypothetical protein
MAVELAGSRYVHLLHDESLLLPNKVISMAGNHDNHDGMQLCRCVSS